MTSIFRINLPILTGIKTLFFFSLRCLPDMSDVRQQHEQVSEAGVLLTERQAALGDGPHQSVGHGVQETQQPGTTL